MKDFDARRAAFWLIACILGVHGVVVLAGIGVCVYYSAEIVSGKFTCDQHDKLSSLLAAALATALALVGMKSEK